MTLSDVCKEITDVIKINDDMAMFCRKDITSINGASLTLYYQKNVHTKEDLKQARRKARSEWDIISTQVIRLEK